MWNTFEVLMIIGAIFLGIGIFLCAIGFIVDIVSNLKTNWIIKPGMVLSIVGFLMFAGFGIPISAHEDDKKENACVSAGGHYEVVRTETHYIYNAATKTNLPQDVDMYGCVK